MATSIVEEENGDRSDNADSDDADHPGKDSHDQQLSTPNVQDLRLYDSVVTKIMNESVSNGSNTV